MQMTRDSWDKIKELFDAAVREEPSHWAAFLAQNCSDDNLRQEVQKLLVNHAEAGSFLKDPIAGANLPTPKQVFSEFSVEAATTGKSSAAVTATESASAFAGGPGCTPPESESSSSEDPMIGRYVGKYRLIQCIGLGGMATVYLAARADAEYRKQVAIKIVPPGINTSELLSRFRNERQTLASLEHPNIVRLLDGGSTEEGLPYLVMDYVEGTPIDDYCDTRKLSIEDRLRLFSKVCAAVQYAHHRLVIHRDLKPSNIMVTADGTPKLLDFGIAKVLDPLTPAQTLVVTQTNTRRMTPAYASPEQVRGESVTTATDIYSLGVVLYELLTGHRPYKLKQPTPAEIERAICEQEPENPSTAVDRVETVIATDGTTSTTITPELVSRTREGEPENLRRRLRGDLDNIVLMALQKETPRRYASVEELSRDLQRHMEHLPVKARQSTLSYRASKFVRRHKTEVIATVLTVLVLVGAIAVDTWESRRAAERARAELAGQRSQGRRSIAVLDLKNLTGRSETAWLSTALSEMLTTELAAGEKLRTISGENVAQMRIDLSLPEADTLAQGTLRRVQKILGSDYVVLGSYLDFPGSNGQIRLDLRLQDALAGETVASVAESGTETDLSDLVSRAGAELRTKLGIAGITAAESSKLKASVPSNPEALRLYAEGLAKLRVFDALGAQDLLGKAVAADPGFALAHSALAEAWLNLGYETKATEEAKTAFELSGNLSREQSLWVEGRYYESSKNWDKATDILRTLFNFFPDNIDYGLHLAKAQTEAGKLDESLDTIKALRKQGSPASDDPRIDLMEANVTQVRTDYKREAEVAAQAQRKGESQGARLLVAEAVFVQGHASRLLGDFNRSIALSSQARQMFASAGDRFGEARALGTLGNVSVQANDLEEAKKPYQEALGIYHQIGNKAQEAGTLMALGTVHLFQRDFAGAVDAYQKSLVLFREVGETLRIAATLHNLALAEKDEGHLARARQHFEEALLTAQHYGDKSLIAGCLINLSAVVAAQGDLAKARKLARESVEVRRHAGSKSRLGEVIFESADLELAAGDITAAEKLYSEALRIFTDAKQDFYASFSLFGLGEILMLRGDLAGARKQLEAALAIRQKAHGSVRELFDSRIRIAELSLEEGHASDAEAAVRDALREYAAQAEPDARIEAGRVLIRSLIAQRKLPEAQEVLASDQKLVAGSENRINRITVNISRSQFLTASGNIEEAATLLQSSVEEAKKSGFADLEFEARLALGEAEIKSGKSAADRAELRSLEYDAKAKGFLLIARKAAVARKH